MIIMFLAFIVVFILVYFGAPNGGIINYYGRYKRFEYALTTALGSLWLVGGILLVIQAIFDVNLL